MKGKDIRKIACGWYSIISYVLSRAHNCMVDNEGNMIIFGRTQDVRNIIGAGNMTSYLPRVLRSFNNLYCIHYFIVFLKILSLKLVFLLFLKLMMEKWLMLLHPWH